MLTRSAAALIGALVLGMALPQSAHADITTTVGCDKKTGICLVEATAPGHSGSRGAGGPSQHEAAAPRQAAPQARSGGGGSRGTHPSGGGSGSQVVVGSSGAGVRVPAAPAAAQLTPSQIITGGGNLAACGGRTTAAGQSFQACLGSPPAPTTPAAPAAATKTPPVKGKKKPPPPTPAQVAAFAVATLHLPKPHIGSAPCTGQDCMGAVGVPVWLWTQPWPTPTATATIRGVSITATAHITKVTWSMGDGQSVTCDSRGTPFDTAYGFTDSPDCGYRYQHTSADQPDMRYPVTATATWRVTWDGDETGTTTTTTLATTRLAIGEYQTVITG